MENENWYKDTILAIQSRYLENCRYYSDIQEHLPVLYRYAAKCESIIECGIRGCVSSWPLVLGLLHNEKEKKKILLNDIEVCNVSDLMNLTEKLPIDVTCEWKNDLDINLEMNYDMIFIDTWHVYGQLKRELTKFSPYINKYIIMHDTTVDEVYGETIREKFDAERQSQMSGIPVEEINCGLGRALSEFLESNDEWILKEKFTNNNGLTVLMRVKPHKPTLKVKVLG